MEWRKRDCPAADRPSSKEVCVSSSSRGKAPDGLCPAQARTPKPSPPSLPQAAAAGAAAAAATKCEANKGGLMDAEVEAPIAALVSRWAGAKAPGEVEALQAACALIQVWAKLN